MQGCGFANKVDKIMNLQTATDLLQSLAIICLVIICIRNRNKSYNDYIHRKNIDPTHQKPPHPPAPPPKKCSCGCD